ncbi:MAG: hypothetical protein RIN56_08870 [Sporomusaceae bacterium]|nr:hypothetical protein [Sporomusaceae bacterium]
MTFFALAATFAPWLVLKFLMLVPLFPPLTMLKISITVATAIAVYQTRQGVHRGLMAWGTLLFFAFCLVTVVLMTNMWVIHHLGVLANGKLTLMTWLSMLVKRPFTLAYAREKVDPQYWYHPQFLRVNYIITGAWAVAFSFNLLNSVAALYGIDMTWWEHELIDNGATLAAIWITMHYSKPRPAVQAPPATNG